MRFTVFATGCLALALLAGCGGKSAEEESANALAERMIERAARESGSNLDVDISSGYVTIRGTDENGEAVNINVDGDTATVTSEDGGVSFATGEAAKIPDDFPKDIPLYDGAQLVTVQQDTGAGMIALTATSSDPAATIAEFYKKKAEASGWTRESALDQGGTMHMLTYKKDSQQLDIFISGDGDATQIQLSLTRP